jgi:hypothetical protein
MPISRPLLIVLVAAVVALVGFYATQGAREGADSAGTDAPIAPVVPAEPADPPAAADQSRPDGSASAGREANEAKAETKRQATDRSTADTAARKRDARRRAREQQIGMPLPFARALRGPDTVVLFLRGSGSADERATARAVAGLRGRRGVTVFTDRIGRLGRYRAVVGELGISQAPAVVIVGRGREARVVEGYVDPTTLAQDVADAR